MKKVILFILLCFASQIHAKSMKVLGLTHQESILLSCLHINYAKIGSDLKDYSGNNYPMSTLIKISDFLEKETGHFYKKQAPVYMENTPPPYTLIFEQCVNFSKSSKVKRFLKTLDLHICNPKSKHKGC